MDNIKDIHVRPNTQSITHTSGTLNLDLTRYDCFDITLNGDLDQLTISGPISIGEDYKIIFRQGGTLRTVTLPATIIVVGSTLNYINQINTTTIIPFTGYSSTEILENGKIDEGLALSKASQAEAEGGTEDTKYLTSSKGYLGWLSWVANKVVAGLNTTATNIVGAINELDASMVSHASNHTDGTDDIQSATNAQKGLATAAHIIAIEANTAKTIDGTAYDATSWNANTDGAQKNAIRDKVVTMDAATAANSITGGETQAPSASLNLDGVVMLTITLTANLVVTSITNVAAGGMIVRYIHGAYTLTVMGIDDFISSNGSYYVAILNTGTLLSPNTKVVDWYSLTPTEIAALIAANGGGLLETAPRTVTSTEILALYATSIVLKTAPGADLIDWPVRAKGYFSHNGTDYTTNTTVNLLSGSTVIGTADILGATTDEPIEFVMSGVPEVNAALSIQTNTGEALAGDGEFGIITYYEQIDLNDFTFAVPFTIGETTILGSTAGLNDRRANQYTMDRDGNIISVSIYHSGSSGNNITVGIYDDATNHPDSRLAVSASTALNTSAGWQTITFSSPLAVSNGDVIWIAFVASASLSIRYGTSTVRRAEGDATYSLADPFGTHTVGNSVMSLYVNCIET